jgi:hypothetical protein
MKKFTTLILFILFSNVIQAQLISNHFNLYFGYDIGFIPGNRNVIEKDYISHSLYTNYTRLSGYSVKGLVKFRDKVSLGIMYQFQTASEWNYNDYFDYRDSHTQLHSILPVIRVHTKFKEQGFFNRGTLFLEIAPTIGLSHLKLSNPVFEIQSVNDSVRPPMKSTDFFWGITGTAGMEYSITQNAGIFMNCSYNYNRVSSILYDDKGFSRSQVSVGFFLRFKKNKYYYY